VIAVMIDCSSSLHSWIFAWSCDGNNWKWTMVQTKHTLSFLIV